MDTNIGGAWIWRKMAGGKAYADATVEVDAHADVSEVEESPSSADVKTAEDTTAAVDPSVESSTPAGLFGDDAATDTKSSAAENSSESRSSRGSRRQSSTQSK